MARPAPLVEHPEVRSAIDLLEAWIVFRAETTDGYGIPGELVEFEVDPAGRVRRARFGENYTERIETWEGR